MQTFTNGNLQAMSGKHRPASAEWDQDVTFCSLSRVSLCQVAGDVFGEWSAFKINVNNSIKTKGGTELQHLPSIHNNIIWLLQFFLNVQSARKVS